MLLLKQNLLELTCGRSIQWDLTCDLFSIDQVQTSDKF